MCILPSDNIASASDSNLRLLRGTQAPYDAQQHRLSVLIRQAAGQHGMLLCRLMRRVRFQAATAHSSRWQCQAKGQLSIIGAACLSHSPSKTGSCRCLVTLPHSKKLAAQQAHLGGSALGMLLQQEEHSSSSSDSKVGMHSSSSSKVGMQICRSCVHLPLHLG